MRKFLFIAAIALLGTLGLGACNNSSQGEAGTQAKATRPADATDIKGWQEYLQQIVEANMGNISNTPYLYFVPAVENPPAAAGTSAAVASGASAKPAPASSAEEALGRVQEQIDMVVAATVLPGNMVAVGGPSSATTALVLESAFKNAAPGSFKGVVVLFIGDQADEAAVKAAVEPSGATFKFAQM
ncbi:MAG TPA: hypothetical protein VFY97_08755 [Rhodanobacteraceae bacterium]|nr:hypothetical protein [Rhodanobacteraceae bacterium]